MSLKELSEKEFNELLKSKGGKAVLFGAPWCAACKIIAPVLEEVAKNFPDILFGEIDVGKTPGFASRMGVMSLPNLLFIKEGKVVEQIIGTASRLTIENKLKELSRA